MKLQKHSFIILMTTLLFTLISTLFLPVSASAQETDKTYIIGTDITFAPFEYKDAEGDYKGIDVDLLDAIAKDQGFNYELRPLGFSAALQALETNQVDGMIAGMSITPERQESFDFSEPYFESGVVMAVSKSNDDITSYEDLEGKTVAIKVGTTGAAFAQSIQEEYGFEVNTFEDSANMYEDVQTGNSDAAFEDYPVMAYAIQSGLELKIPTDPEPGDNYGFAVNKEQNAELLEMFNNGLINIRANGTYDDIINSYLGDTTQKETANLGFFGLIQQNGGELLKGLGRTLLLTITAFVIATILGVIFGLFSATPNRALNWIATIYVDILRGIPLIVLAFFIYFSIPQFLGIQIPAYIAGVITLSLNTTA